MNKLTSCILERRKKGPLFMPYLTLGDPDFDHSVKFATALIDAGADILELGIPFSDPTADGPVIQAAMVRSMSLPNFSIETIFETVSKIHKARPNTPLVFLSYMNPVFRGFASPGRTESDSLKRFLDQSASSGIQAIVIPDLPPDQPEAELFARLGEPLGISQIFMAAPNTSSSRLKQMARMARGFVYYVTSYGVTGERKDLPPEISEQMERVKNFTGLPVFAGFGFSEPAQVLPIKKMADGVIVGSLNHRIIEKLGRDAEGELVTATKGFVEALAGA